MSQDFRCDLGGHSRWTWGKFWCNYCISVTFTPLCPTRCQALGLLTSEFESSNLSSLKHPISYRDIISVKHRHSYIITTQRTLLSFSALNKGLRYVLTICYGFNCKRKRNRLHALPSRFYRARCSQIKQTQALSFRVLGCWRCVTKEGFKNASSVHQPKTTFPQCARPMEQKAKHTSLSLRTPPCHSESQLSTCEPWSWP